MGGKPQPDPHPLRRSFYQGDVSRRRNTSLAPSCRSSVLGRAPPPAPTLNAAAASMAFKRSRKLRGVGKYSSSSVMRTSRTPSRGASRSITDSTSSSLADAPAVTPTVPDRSLGSSSAVLTRSTLAQPLSVASRARAIVFDEFDDPMTTIASHSGAILTNAP